jgi:predicted dehydrogenase
MIAIQKALHDDQVIGDVTALYTNLSLNAIGRRPDTDRVLAAELGGGALLDLGPYPWTWVCVIANNIAEATDTLVDDALVPPSQEQEGCAREC